MGKERDLKSEPPGAAFTRMSFLYQAAQLMSTTSIENPLSNYYNKIMKEISKKIVEKIHPDVKRTICSSCNHPLTARNNQINVKVKTFNKKKRKRKAGKNLMCKKISENYVESKISQTNKDKHSYIKSRIDMRNKKPNKVFWCCKQCGFSKKYFQKPSYKLWIHDYYEKEAK